MECGDDDKVQSIDYRTIRATSRVDVTVIAVVPIMAIEGIKNIYLFLVYIKNDKTIVYYCLVTI